jgi:hypothetical protein
VRPLDADVVTPQTSEGVTQSEFTQELLVSLEKWVVQTTTQKASNAYADMGHDLYSFMPQTKSNTAYVTFGSTKLAVVKMQMGDHLRIVVVLGVKHGEFQRAG